MPLGRALRVVGLLTVVACTAFGLSACATDSAAEIDPDNRPTMAPEQSTAEACAASKADVEKLVAAVQAQVSQAGEDLTAGKLPNVDGFVQEMQESAQSLGDNVQNIAVLDALEAVRTEVDGFAEITAPGTLFEVPGYLNSLGAQFGKLQESGKHLKEICATE